MAKRRAAVAIGVNKTGGGLPPLVSAASNAHDISEWLIKEGFEVVKVITDEHAPVTLQDIFDPIEKLVEAQVYDQLVVYFSGHGIWKNRDELWLLSKAPSINAAVSWTGSVDQAWVCGIPHVVIVSDACRTPGPEQYETLRGDVIFPLEPRMGTRKVDTFRAALVGTPAYEIRLKSRQAGFGKTISVFTHCLRQAYISPDPDMVLTVREDGETLRVVPNRRLEPFLLRKVDALLKDYDPSLAQTPDVRVPSDDNVYIARVEPEPLIVERQPTERTMEDRLFDIFIAWWSILIPDFTWYQLQPPPPQTPASLGEVAGVAVAEALELHPRVSTKRLLQINELAQASGFEQAIDTAMTTVAGVAHLETGTGFTVTGAGVDDAQAYPGGRATILQHGGERSVGIVQLEPIPPAGHSLASTVVLRFNNGNGAPIAALYGYIGHVVVEDGSVVTVNYVPADNSHRWPFYQRRRARIERLRAAAAAAARFGVFQLDDKARAADLADLIREEKMFDPSLGLYAAYAYSQAGQEDDVKSVLRFMHEDLLVDFFDVAMLTRRLHGAAFPSDVVPFCPVLTQGWNLLRSRRIELPKVLGDGEDDLVPALWTTFDPHRADLILAAMRKGELR
jgi:hypothetical protein